MIQKVKSKQEVRKEMEQAIEDYLKTGGEIKHIQQGISGREDNANLNLNIPFTPSEHATRTPVNDTIKAIDERRQKKKTSTEKSQKPRKKIIYDDFGEPIREIWE